MGIRKEIPAGMTFNSGAPPGIGWWLTKRVILSGSTIAGYSLMWRWWDQVRWSVPVEQDASAEKAAFNASMHAIVDNSSVEWSNHYPENARIPRELARNELS
jgi:hypothetical protein